MKNNISISNRIKLNPGNLQSINRSVLLIILLFSLISHSFSQNDTDTLTIGVSNNEILQITEPGDETGVIKSEKEIEKVEEPIDTTVVKLGNKLYKFIEYEEALVIDRIDLKTGEIKQVLNIGSKECESKKDTNRFRGHWSGIEVGVNDFVNNGFSLNRPAGYDYMDLKTFRSWNISLNFAQLSIPLVKNRVGLVTGFGLELNNYYLEGKNSFQKNESTGIIEERILENDYNIRKSKFTTTHLTMPLILEAQIGKAGRKEYFYISGGIIGGLKIGSAIKIKHKVEGNKLKIIERGGDLNINRYRAGLTLCMGHKDKDNNSSGLFATYYFTQFFEEGMGPELYPFTIGLKINF